MKESKYNFFFKIDEEKYVFNAITCALAKIDDLFEENLKCVINDEKIDSDLLNNMKKSGIVVEDCFDELNYLKLENMKGKFNCSHVGITIAPTMMCNFACPYCYESPRPMFMKDEVMEAIFEKVKESAESKKSVSITWFGGEPLLAKDVIWKLSERLIDVCRENNVNYTARMVSNSYLVDDSVIENMIKYKILRIQVTVDGTPDIHNARRRLKNSNEPTFDKILTNIKKMSDAGIKVIIRVNVDKTNVKCVDELIPELKKYGLEKCLVYLGKVTNSTDATEHIADTCLDMSEYSHESSKWQQMLSDNGFKSKSYPMYPTCKKNFCLADCYSMFSVDGDGNMYKCWHDIGVLSKSIGNILNKDDNVKTKKLQEQFSNFSKYILWSPFDFKKCTDCKVLPICMGGCPSSGIKRSEPDCAFWKYNLIDFLKLRVKCEKNKSLIK